MEDEWHASHCIKEESNLISFLREYETNTTIRNVMRRNNRYDLLNFSSILKIPTLYLPSRTYMVQPFLRKSLVFRKKKAPSQIIDWIVNTSLLLL